MRYLLIAVVLSCSASPAIALPYWPSEAGAEFQYGSVSVSIISHLDGFARTYVRPLTSTIVASGFTGYAIDDDGDVVVTGSGSTVSVAPDPEQVSYDPPWKLLDYPLTVGKTWSSTCSQIPLWGEPDPWTYPDVTWTSTVIGFDVVSTPYGDLDVIVIQTSHEQLGETWTSERRLHINLGPVEGLTGYSGIVPTESCTWSDLKALYR